MLNDFWNRVTGYGIGDGTPVGQGKISPHILRAMLVDAAAASGGITAANAKIYMQIVGTGTAETEYSDLIASVANVTNANAVVQRSLRTTCAEVVACGGFISDLGTGIGGGTNPYETGEQLRLRVKALITALASTGAAALVGSMAV
jgi:hypothetical protein